MKKTIHKKDAAGSTTIEIEHPHDDVYFYLRISGAYFLLFSFLFGFVGGLIAAYFLSKL
jgi:hypothetical protein